MNPFISMLLAGMLVGFGVGILTSRAVLIDPLIEECEQPLPRTEKCVLAAVPEAK